MFPIHVALNGKQSNMNNRGAVECHHVDLGVLRERELVRCTQRLLECGAGRGQKKSCASWVNVRCSSVVRREAIVMMGMATMM